MLNKVLVAGEELRDAAAACGPITLSANVAADHQPLQLLDLQLGDAVDRPRQRDVDPRHHARLDHRPKRVTTACWSARTM